MELFNNFAKTTLTAAISTGNTTINVASGSVFPTPANGDYFMVVLAKPSAGEETTWEICKCTARNNNTLTVERGQEGTTAKSWAIGDKAENRLTAGSLQRLSSSSSNGGGMTYGGKVTITASSSVSDPSQGRGREFRITLVGGGGGGYVMLTGNVQNFTSSGGGAGESIVMTLYKGEITWPVQVTIGAAGANYNPTTSASSTNGGSSSFGSLVTAIGGERAISTYNNGAGAGHSGGAMANRCRLALGNNGTPVSGGQRGTTANPSGADSSVIQTDRATYYSGGGGGYYRAGSNGYYYGLGGKCGIYANITANELGGCSLLGKSGSGAPGSGGGESGVANAGPGVCIIEWFE